MNTTIEQQREDWQVVQAMKHWGGGFVKQLATLFLHADKDNQRRIREAWPEYWAEYAAHAEWACVQYGRDWWDAAPGKEVPYPSANA